MFGDSTETAFEVFIPILGVVSLLVWSVFLAMVAFYYVRIRPDKQQFRTVIQYFLGSRGFVNKNIFYAGINRDDVSFVAVMEMILFNRSGIKLFENPLKEPQPE